MSSPTSSPRDEHIDTITLRARAAGAKLKISISHLGSALQSRSISGKPAITRTRIRGRYEGMYLRCSPATLPMAVDMFDASPNLCRRIVSTRQSPTRASPTGHSSLSGYFRSHPVPSERLAQASASSGGEHWGNSTGQSRSVSSISSQRENT